MKLSPVEEDYLKNILKLSGKEEKLVKTGFLSSAMSLTAGTVTSMIKSLEKKDFIEYLPRKGCRLTRIGREKALSVLRRHRLLETLLVNMGMERDDVHKEAEILEHSISSKVENLLDQYLSFPETDPHGNPIPSFKLPEKRPSSLVEAPKNTPLKILTVGNISHETQNFFSSIHLEKDKTVMVIEINIPAGVIFLSTKKGTHYIALSYLKELIVMPQN